MGPARTPGFSTPLLLYKNRVKTLIKLTTQKNNLDENQIALLILNLLSILYCANTLGSKAKLSDNCPDT